MKTSRQQVLEYVQAHYPVTAADLGQALQMTQANARHHLAILEGRGLVQAAGQRQPEGKGRPAQLFMPSEQSLGHNLDRLASALLEALKRQGEPGGLEAALQRLAEQIAAAETPEAQAKEGTSLTQRLYDSVQRLNALHYQARWEAWRGAPRVILGHCPYAAIIQGHPELCRMDAHLLERLAGAQAKQTAKLSPDNQGALHCTFHIEDQRKRLIKM